MEQAKGSSVVSVIIPCYNHAHFLPEAIESVQQQHYPNVEIVVVDDGSSDNTREVAESFPGVKYVYQTNKGLSAARNTGIENSTGEFLLFLDADDWLTPNSIERNVQHLLKDEKLAFVSGGHRKVFVDEKVEKKETREVTSDHYNWLLQGNYIGVPAAVMFRRWAFDEILYDTTPPNSCADYDLTLRVARKFPVAHHTDIVASYRIHSASMSANIPGMLETVLKVLKLQESHLKTKEERQALKKGEAIWKEYYCKELYWKLVTGKVAPSESAINTLFKFSPKYFIKYFLHQKAAALKGLLK